MIMKKDKTNNNSREWTVETLHQIPLNGWKVLNVFVQKNKNILDSEEIKEALKGKLAGKRLGGALGIFGKYRTREHLLSPLVKLTHTKTVWEIQPKYFPMIKEHVQKIGKYL